MTSLYTTVDISLLEVKRDISRLRVQAGYLVANIDASRCAACTLICCSIKHSH